MREFPQKWTSEITYMCKFYKFETQKTIISQDYNFLTFGGFGEKG